MCQVQLISTGLIVLLGTLACNKAETGTVQSRSGSSTSSQANTQLNQTSTPALIAPVASLPPPSPAPTPPTVGSGSTPVPYVMRIAAGRATDFTDSTGKVWLSDRNYSGGIASTPEPYVPVTGTNDSDLYQGERFGRSSSGVPGPFSYTFNRLAAGDYLVTLKFAETYHSQVGFRRFHVDINGSRVLDQFDIVQDVGAGAASDHQFPLRVDAAGVIKIDFIPGQIECPKVDAIEVVSVP